MKFIDIPTEQTTAITDVFLALVALGCLRYLRQIGTGNPWKTNLWSWVFGLLALAAILGAIAHGFQMSRKLNNLIWQPLNLSLGITVALFVAAVIYILVRIPKDNILKRAVSLWVITIFFTTSLIMLVVPKIERYSSAV